MELSKIEMIEYFDTNLQNCDIGWGILKDYLILSPYTKEVENYKSINYVIHYIKEIDKNLILNYEKLIALEYKELYELFSVFSNYVNSKSFLKVV